MATYVYILTALAPVALVIVLGFFLRRQHFLDIEVWNGLNRLVYWVGLPVLLFSKVATSGVVSGVAMKMFLVLFLATVCIVGLSILAGSAFGISRQSFGAFIQASFRGNLAYIGLAIVFFSVEVNSPGRAQQLQSLAVVAIAPLVPIYNILAVVALTTGSGGGGDTLEKCRNAVVNIAKNPLIIACAAGFLVKVTGISIPAPFLRTFDVIAQMALPLALLGVGASMAVTRIQHNVGVAFSSALLKVVGTPLITFLLCMVFNVTSVERQIALLFAACPTAVSSYVLANALGGDEEMSSVCVVFSTVLAFPAFALFLAVL